jgi:hypothetical protein
MFVQTVYRGIRNVYQDTNLFKYYVEISFQVWLSGQQMDEVEFGVEDIY